MTNPAIEGTFLCFLMPVPSPDKWGGLRQEGHPASFICQIIHMHYNHQSIPDRSRPSQQPPQMLHSRGPVEIMLLINIVVVDIRVISP